MCGDRIDFISEYCDRWCERCAFTGRCSAYAVKVALEMCEGDFEAAIELAVGAPPPRNEARKRAGELLADYYPTEQELAAIGREMEDREDLIDESSMTTDAVVVSTLASVCLRRHCKPLEDHHDPSVREAFETASWDCHLIGAKLHRALSGHNEADCDDSIETDPIQNDWTDRRRSRSSRWIVRSPPGPPLPSRLRILTPRRSRTDCGPSFWTSSGRSRTRVGS